MKKNKFNLRLPTQSGEGDGQGDKKSSMPCDASNDCKLCCEEVKDSDKALLCSRCKKWVHVSCLKMSHNDYKCLKRQPTVMWFCEEDCLENAESIFNQLPNSSLADLNEKIDKLVSGFANLQLEKKNEEQILDKKIEEKVKMVLREEKEIEERKLNLLVFGLPEAAPEASESERLGNDLIQLKDVFTELEIDVEVSNLTRLGKLKNDNGSLKRRPVRFSVKDTQVKSKILAEAKNLKKSLSLDKVYIYPDRKPKQRKEYSELISEAKRRREAGENIAVVNGVLKVFRAKPAGTAGALS